MDCCSKDGKVYIILRNISRYQLNIPEEELMERFVRGDESRTSEGHGLGLAIARSAIVMHRGAIRVYSKENEGTTFSVRIPLNYVM